MKLSKCFTTVFDGGMKAAGFSRKGVLYYRMKGTILQGVFLKATNPYSLCFAAFPYWLYYKRLYPDPDIAKGYWTQLGGMLMTTNYYAPDRDEENTRDMEAIFGLVLEYILPYLDGIDSESAYLDMVMRTPTDLFMGKTVAEPFIRSMESPSAAIFLYAQHYLPASPSAKETVEQWHRGRWERYLAWADQKGHSEQNREYERENLRRMRDRLLHDIEALEQEGFPAVYEGLRADMTRQLSEQLKIRMDE